MPDTYQATIYQVYSQMLKAVNNLFKAIYNYEVFPTDIMLINQNLKLKLINLLIQNRKLQIIKTTKVVWR